MAFEPFEFSDKNSFDQTKSFLKNVVSYVVVEKQKASVVTKCKQTKSQLQTKIVSESTALVIQLDVL